MKSTGVIRKIDETGRISVPKEIRDNLGIDNNTKIEIMVDGENIVLRKFSAECKCIMCGSLKDLTSLYDKNICRKCINKLINQNEQ